MPKADKVAGALALLFLISMFLPGDWADSIHFGSIPLGGFVFVALCLVLVAELLKKPAAMSFGLAIGALALTFTSVLGYLRGNVETYYLKFFGADIFCLGALIAGYALARTQGRDRTTRFVIYASLIAGIIIILTYLSLFAGLISTEFKIGGRTVTSSIFMASAALLVFLPWATVSTYSRDTAGGWRTWFLFLTAIGTGLLSATRSIVIEVIVAAFLYIVLKRRKLSPGFVLKLAGGALLMLVVLMSSVFGTFVFSRLGHTDIADESRTVELEMMWPQIENDLAFGQGMGSRFVSNVIISGNPLASAPHVGIVAFIVKGGIPLFIWYGVIPLFVAIYVFFLPRFPEQQRGAAAAVLMFIVSGSLSGGWFPSTLFTYGIALASMMPNRSRLSYSSQQYSYMHVPSIAPSPAPHVLQR